MLESEFYRNWSNEGNQKDISMDNFAIAIYSLGLAWENIGW